MKITHKYNMLCKINAKVNESHKYQDAFQNKCEKQFLHGSVLGYLFMQSYSLVCCFFLFPMFKKNQEYFGNLRTMSSGIFYIPRVPVFTRYENIEKSKGMGHLSNTHKIKRLDHLNFKMFEKEAHIGNEENFPDG